MLKPKHTFNIENNLLSVWMHKLQTSTLTPERMHERSFGLSFILKVSYFGNLRVGQGSWQDSVWTA